MTKGKKGQLVFGEREVIERSILRKESISSIGRALGRPASTVEREIKRNGVSEPEGHLAVTARNICVHKDACARTDLCGKGCMDRCRQCGLSLCNKLCPDFEAEPCPLLEKPPYCCNGCMELYGYGCRHPYRFYEAKAAQEIAMRRKKESRVGIDCTQEELAATMAIVSAGLAKGQSLSYIFEVHKGEVCCTARTFYNWIEDGITADVPGERDILNIDLRRKVKYKPRKKKPKEGAGVPREALAGRTHDDFKALDEKERMSAVEADCVVGRLGVDSQVILTLLFRRTNFQIMMLLASQTKAEVVSALDALESLVGGPEQFSRVFPILLCDRGTEFADVERMEHSRNGKPRTRVFFCDPMRSNQKGKCEKNHEEMRKVLPKGKTNFDALAKSDMAVLMSHVNSYARDSLNWAAPYDLEKLRAPQDLLDGLGVERIPADDVTLEPYLIAHAIVRK